MAGRRGNGGPAWSWLPMPTRHAASPALPPRGSCSSSLWGRCRASRDERARSPSGTRRVRRLRFRPRSVLSPSAEASVPGARSRGRSRRARRPSAADRLRRPCSAARLQGPPPVRPAAKRCPGHCPGFPRCSGYRRRSGFAVVLGVAVCSHAAGLPTALICSVLLRAIRPPGRRPLLRSLRFVDGQVLDVVVKESRRGLLPVRYGRLLQAQVAADAVGAGRRIGEDLYGP